MTDVKNNGIATAPRNGAVDTALRKTCSFDLSGCREYVASRDCVLTITDAPVRAYFARDCEHSALRLRLISVCRKAKILNRVVKCLGRVNVSLGRVR